jgi:hypothetical protein
MTLRTSESRKTLSSYYVCSEMVVASGTVVGIALFLWSSLAFADVPNVFDPKHMSSAALTAGVNSCNKNAVARFGNDRLKAMQYCTCVMDGIDAKKSIMDAAGRCVSWVRNGKKKTREINLFRRRAWPTSRRYGAFMGCFADMGKQVPFKRKMSFCSCLGDYMGMKISHAAFQRQLKRKGSAAAGRWIEKRLKKSMSQCRSFLQ